MGISGNETTRIRLVVGLGNPGKEYEETRHNVGFMVLSRLRNLLSADFERMSGCASTYWRGKYAGRNLFLQAPTTFMNLSGEAVISLMRHEELTPAEVLVISDDMDLEVGHLRIRTKGSCGGHNGLRSIFEHLGTEAIARIRVGIGHGANGVDHVLSAFTETEKPVMEKVLDAAAEAVKSILKGGIQQSMNYYNALDFSPETEKQETIAETKSI